MQQMKEWMWEQFESLKLPPVCGKAESTLYLRSVSLVKIFHIVSLRCIYAVDRPIISLMRAPIAFRLPIEFRNNQKDVGGLNGNDQMLNQLRVF